MQRSKLLLRQFTKHVIFRGACILLGLRKKAAGKTPKMWRMIFELLMNLNVYNDYLSAIHKIQQPTDQPVCNNEHFLILFTHCVHEIKMTFMFLQSSTLHYIIMHQHEEPECDFICKKRPHKRIRHTIR